MKVKIRGNITYEQKSIGFFTTAQLIYTVIGTLTAIGIYNLIHNVLPVVFSTLLATAVFIVIAALGFLNLGGMKATEVIRRIFKIALGRYKYKYMTEVDYVSQENEGRNKCKKQEKT